LKYFMVVISVFFLVSCNKKMSYMMSGYEGSYLQGGKLNVIYIDDDVFIGNAENLNATLGKGKPDSVFMAFFEQEFALNMRQYSTFTEVKYSKLENRNNFIQQSLIIESPNSSTMESFQVIVPANGVKLETDHPLDRYILFIEEIETYESASTRGVPMTTISPGGAMMVTELGGAGPQVHIRIMYILWDNDFGHMIAYGNIDEFSSIRGKNGTSENWHRALNDAIKGIFNKSPFRKKKRKGVTNRPAGY
jgi:hypothetical protein